MGFDPNLFNKKPAAPKPAAPKPERKPKEEKPVETSKPKPAPKPKPRADEGELRELREKVSRLEQEVADKNQQIELLIAGLAERLSQLENTQVAAIVDPENDPELEIIVNTVFRQYRRWFINDQAMAMREIFDRVVQRYNVNIRDSP